MSESREEGRGTQEVLVRDLAPRDLWAAADIHRASFAEDPVSLLGREATRRYYEWLLNGPHGSEGFGAYMDQRLVGVLVGGSFGSLLPGYLRRNFLHVVSRLALRPRLLAHAAIGGRALRRLRGRGAADPGNDERGNAPPFPGPAAREEPAWELLAIAVSPDARGHGIGAVLVKEAARRAEAAGFHRMELSVHPENARAIRFYEGIGWRKCMSGEQWTGRMSRAVTSAPGGPGAA